MKKASTAQPAASSTFHERERKLNAASGSELDALRDFIIKDPHYATLDDPRFVLPLLRGFALRTPQEDSALRFRVYFDNTALAATRSGIEIRLEQRPDADWPCKQVIKIGRPGNEKNHTLDRIEHTTKLKTLQPNLAAVKGEGADYIKEIFNARALGKIPLLPLVAIASQRWKLLYHPDGNPDVQIELATDIGRGQTCDGFMWDMFQCEIEMKKGDPAWLENEETRLRRALPFLEVETRSKPSPGFDHLADVLDRKKNRETIRYALKDGAFRNLSF